MLSPLFGLGNALMLSSLSNAARSDLVLAPMAAGVQEGAFAMVGIALHFTPADALGLSLLLRARDVVLGTPLLLIWYVHAAETHRGLRWSQPPGGTA